MRFQWHQMALLAFHGTCVRFQWHIKRVYLNSTGLVWGFSDISNDFICIPWDLREVSVTYQSALLAFHGNFLRFKWPIRRLYWHSTGISWCLSDISDDFIGIPRDFLEVSVTYQKTLLAFHGTFLRCQWHIRRLYWHSTGLAWGFSDISNNFICFPDVLLAGRIFAMVPRETKSLECSTSLNSSFICI